MSLYGSMFTAISGLTAQSRALGNVADNVANSQTTGYKRVDTNFVAYVTQSTRSINQPGSVVARPDYANSVQGTIQQSENPLAMAVAGAGFFSVAQSNGRDAEAQPTFDARPFYTRAGDFALDRDGYLVNGQGYYLQGWSADAAGAVDRTATGPLRVDQSVFNPVATSTVEVAANLPASSTLTTPVGTQVQVYDGLGRQHDVQMSYQRVAGAPNTWRLTASWTDGAGAAQQQQADLRFGPVLDANGQPVAGDTTPAGTIAAITPVTAGVTAPAAATPGTAATLGMTMNFGQGDQPVSFNLGSFAAARGLTQYAGEEYEVRNLTQNGIPLGSFSSVAVGDNGDISVNYNNGQSKVIARVPVVNFSDPDRLQRVDGQAFLRTPESGEARIADASANGSGKIVTGSLESSNVDVASEFSKLILAQRAYTANTKIVTASDEMLQDVINMRR